MSLLDPLSYLVLSAGIFAGAVVSGMVGFAFSAVAGAVLLHVLPPIEAVTLMTACSVVPQAASLVALRRHIRWRSSLMLIAGGALGVAPALFLLQHVDALVFRIGFGVFLTVYAGYMLLRPAVAHAHRASGPLRDVAIGFSGGLVGGLTAMPGALPTIWCDLRGMPKDERRGLLQPYITAMQVLALALMVSHNGLSDQTLTALVVSLPALAIGTALGVVMIGRVGDTASRRAVLAVLLVAGIGLVV